ncbi:hypothetical protein CI102_201 [Trichoderma harzianum]|uniref:Uncharacterized protein n=1 Tax=Trichoderma harzianum CBS 226.95 TaxID=983964 RepID=A0A2T3ZWA8_TRIHA|nr:hypothetical protein M431DRAFT_317126 [Trichoderma harzianum CBS 226.95]PKK54934.1 hypothetical protein CI102_201 [Trichoderma harzianum]PTB49094.1 hypothetical protein M431DRAFT_317126 [Trichoderma harzianum CBS 226.95]
MEHPGRGPLGSTSTCREDSDEAIIPFGVPSCCPFYRKPTLLYVMARGTVRVLSCPVRDTAQHARGCSVPLRRLTSTPVASIYKAPSAIFLAPHPLRILSHVPEPMPWPLQCTHERTELSVDLFSVGEGSTCGAESNRVESVQRSGETPQRTTEQGRVAWRT